MGPGNTRQLRREGPRRPRPHRYKLFLFAYWSPDDPKAYGYRKTFYSSTRLSPHGDSLQTLGRLLAGAPLTLYQPVESDPPLAPEIDETKSSLEAFTIGKRLVVAVHWVRPASPEPGGEATTHVSLHLPELPRDSIATAERWEAAGWRRILTDQLTGGGDGKGARLRVPLFDETDLTGDWWGFEGSVHTFYVVFTRR